MLSSSSPEARGFGGGGGASSQTSSFGGVKMRHFPATSSTGRVGGDTGTLGRELGRGARGSRTGGEVYSNVFSKSVGGMIGGRVTPCCAKSPS